MGSGVQVRSGKGKHFIVPAILSRNLRRSALTSFTFCGVIGGKVAFLQQVRVKYNNTLFSNVSRIMKVGLID